MLDRRAFVSFVIVLAAILTPLPGYATCASWAHATTLNNTAIITQPDVWTFTGLSLTISKNFNHSDLLYKSNYVGISQSKPATDVWCAISHDRYRCPRQFHHAADGNARYRANHGCRHQCDDVRYRLRCADEQSTSGGHLYVSTVGVVRRPAASGISIHVQHCGYRSPAPRLSKLTGFDEELLELSKIVFVGLLRPEDKSHHIPV